MASIANITAALILDVSKFKGQLEGAEKQILKTNRALQTAGINLTAALTLPLAMFGRDAVRTAAEFGLIQAKIAGLNQQTKVIDSLANSARQLGRDSIFTAVEVSKMQLELVKLGLAEGEIVAVQEAAVQFAQALDIDLATAASTVIELMNKMPKSFDEFDTRAEAAKYATNAFAYAAAESALDVDGLTASLNYVGAEADAMGFSFEQTVAMLAALANAGYKGSRAGTQLRRIMVELSKGGEEATAEFKRFVQSGASFNEILDQVGIRAAGMGAALQGQLPFIERFSAGMQNSAGYLETVGEAIEGSLEYSIQRTLSAFKEFQLSIVSDLEPVLKLLLDVITALTNSFSRMPKAMKIVVATMLILAATIGPAIILVTRYNLMMAQLAIANARAAASFKVLQTSLGIIGILSAIVAVGYELVNSFNEAARAADDYEKARSGIKSSGLQGLEETLGLDKQRLSEINTELEEAQQKVLEYAKFSGTVGFQATFQRYQATLKALLEEKKLVEGRIKQDKQRIDLMKQIAAEQAKRDRADAARAATSGSSFDELLGEYKRLGVEITNLQRTARNLKTDPASFLINIQNLQEQRDEIKGVLETLGYSFDKGAKPVDKWQEAISTASTAWSRAEAQFAVDGDEIARLEAFAASQRELAIAAEILDKTGTQTGIDALKDFIEFTKRSDAAKAAKALADGIDEANAAFSQSNAITDLQLTAGIIDQKAAVEQLASAYETLATSLYDLGQIEQAAAFAAQAAALRKGSQAEEEERQRVLEQNQELLSFVQSIGNAVGNIFKDLTSGTRSFAETLKRNMIDALTAILAKLVAIAVMWGIIAILSGGTSMTPKASSWARGIQSGGFGAFAMGQFGLGSLGKNKSMGVTVDGQISGHTIYLSNKRALSSYDRTYGG